MMARRIVAISLALAVILLAGCASAPSPAPRPTPPVNTPPPIAKPAPSPVTPPIASAPAPSVPAAEPPPREPIASAPPAADEPPRTRGGFYLDDGPHDKPPPNLDAIPEPEPKPEPLHRFANNPYVVFGVRYVPERELRANTSRGVASWYGRRFHGNPTATGEIYDMFALTAAHPTLPLPSYARVTNLANGRSVTVRVNDRGPFLHGRAIDLSYAAAARLGFIERGSAQVEIESLNPRESAIAHRRETTPREVPAPVAVASAPSPAPTVAASPATAPAPVVQTAMPIVEDARGVFVQLGAYRSPGNAENVLARFIFQLEDLASRLRIVLHNGLHRIWAGPYRSRAEALAAAAQFSGLQQ